MAQPFVWAAYQWYLSKPRWYKYGDLKIRVLPSVFYPGWLGSTKVMLHYLLQKDLNDKRVLELGAGSGLISIVAAKTGASVTATDVNPHAIASMRESTSINGLSIHLIESNLFDKVPLQGFDYIVINPPYYPKKPENYRELAFYCGEDYDFFKRLFYGIQPYLAAGSQVFMVLSESCEIEMIRSHAKLVNLQMNEMEKVRKQGEWHFIFGLTLLE